MGEYEEKMEELRALARYFNEHNEEIKKRDDAVAIYAIEGRHFTECTKGRIDYIVAVVAALVDLIKRKQGKDERETLM